MPRARNLHDLHNHPQSKFLKVSEEVRDAVATRKPVVALETTIYTHGELKLPLELDDTIVPQVRENLSLTRLRLSISR